MARHARVGREDAPRARIGVLGRGGDRENRPRARGQRGDDDRCLDRCWAEAEVTRQMFSRHSAQPRPPSAKAVEQRSQAVRARRGECEDRQGAKRSIDVSDLRRGLCAGIAGPEVVGDVPGPHRTQGASDVAREQWTGRAAFRAAAGLQMRAEVCLSEGAACPSGPHRQSTRAQTQAGAHLGWAQFLDLEEQQHLLFLRGQGVECLLEEVVFGAVVADPIVDWQVEHRLVIDGVLTTVRAVQAVAHGGEQIRAERTVRPAIVGQLGDDPGEGFRHEVFGISVAGRNRAGVLECRPDVLAVKLGNGFLIAAASPA